MLARMADCILDRLAQDTTSLFGHNATQWIKRGNAKRN
jgi:hypothetical protein